MDTMEHNRETFGALLKSIINRQHNRRRPIRSLSACAKFHDKSACNQSESYIACMQLIYKSSVAGQANQLKVAGCMYTRSMYTNRLDRSANYIMIMPKKS